MMDTYLFKFSACLLVFWLVYILVLERQKMHHLKRFYLLGSVVLALIIPILTITYYLEPVVTDFEVSPLFIPIEPQFVEASEEILSFWNLENILWLVYGLGVFIFSSRFIVNLVKMYKRISGHTKISERSFIYVLLKEPRIPHSFFNYIFLNKSKYEVAAIPKEVILHEETHAKQLHSVDVMAIELLQIVFWFHPLVYILKHHMKLNHEFLADQAVLEEGIDTKAYQNILLQFSSNTQDYQLSSAINYSSIKKRFTVMKTQTSKTRIWVSSLLLLPIIAILFYSFAEKEYVKKENSKISEVIANELEKANDLQVIYHDGATEAMMKEYKDWIKRLNNNSSSLFIPLGTNERIVAIYDLMSKVQRNSVETHPFFQENPNLYKVESSVPTTDQFESWKNEKEFAIWLDGKHISNSELKNYKINDIAHYVGSSVHSNAQSKKLAQPFQFNLYTKDGFNTFYKDVFVSDYRALTKTYSNAINTYLNGSQTDNSELRILKAQADKFYNQFTKDELDKYNLLPAPPVPAEKKLRSSQSKNKASKGGPNLEDSQGTYNPSFLEYIIEMEKEGASFFLDDVKITAKKAKSIATDNKGKRTEMITQKDTDGNYLVKLSSSEKNKIYARSIDLKVLNDNSYLVDGIKATKHTFIDVFNQLHQDITPETRNKIMNIHISSSKEVSNKETWFIYNSLQDYGFYRIVTPNQEINRAKGNTPFAIESHLSTQQKATVKQIAAYNTWSKELNSKDIGDRIVKLKDHNKFKAIYDSMSDIQRKNAQPFPQLPPPPPPAPKQIKTLKTQLNNSVEDINSQQEKSGPIEINGATYYFSQNNGETTYYDQYGKVVDINKIPPPPPIPNDATPEQKTKMKKASDAYMKANVDKVGKAKSSNREVIDVIEVPKDLQGSVDINGETFYYTSSKGKTKYFNRYGKEVKMDNLPPPPPVPESTLDFVIRMAKTNAKFFSEGKSISSDNAIDLIKKHPKLNVNAQKTDTRQPLVYITKKPILIGEKAKD